MLEILFERGLRLSDATPREQAPKERFIKFDGALFCDFCSPPVPKIVLPQRMFVKGATQRFYFVCPCCHRGEGYMLKQFIEEGQLNLPPNACVFDPFPHEPGSHHGSEVSDGHMTSCDDGMCADCIAEMEAMEAGEKPPQHLIHCESPDDDDDPCDCDECILRESRRARRAKKAAARRRKNKKRKK